jgi:hypothetical protein
MANFVLHILYHSKKIESHRKLFVNIHILRGQVVGLGVRPGHLFWKSSPSDADVYSFVIVLTHVV